MLSEKEIKDLTKKKVFDALMKKTLYASTHGKSGHPPTLLEIERLVVPEAEKINNMLWRIKKSPRVHNFTPEFVYRLIEHSEAAIPSELTKIIRTNLAFAKTWQGWERKAGTFKLKPIFLPHNEAPFGIAVTFEGIQLGTIGGFVDKRAGEKTVVLTNLQGVPAKQVLAEMKIAKIPHAGWMTAHDILDLYKRMDSELGRHWRLNLVNMVSKEAQKQLKMRVEGEAPRRSKTMTDEQYNKLYKRQRQTFIEAGFKPKVRRKTKKSIAAPGRDKKWILKKKHR